MTYDEELEELQMLLPEFPEDTSLANLPTTEEELAVTIRAVGLLSTTLTKILSNCETTGKDTVYLWDWEMVQEAIDPYSASSVFSGVLWSGLDQLAQQPQENRARIIYAEGTRRELLWYLSQRVNDYQKETRVSATSSTEEAGTGLKAAGFGERRDWKEVLEKLGKIMRLDESVDRLIYLLERYAEPMPLEHSKISSDRVSGYQNQLREIRQDDDRRINEADAWNLACLDEISFRVGSRRDVGLVTATNAVRTVRGQVTRDPFYFTLDMQLRREYQDMQQRCIALHEMLARLHQILAKLLELYAMADPSKAATGSDARAELRRREALGLFSALKSSLQNDPILNHISNLLVRSAEVLNNSRLQATRASSALDVSSGVFSGLSQFEHKVNRALERIGIENPTARDLRLDWTSIWQQSDVHRLILGNTTRRFIEAEVTSNSFAVSWEAGITLAAFLRYAENTWLSDVNRALTSAKMIVVRKNKPVTHSFDLITPLELFRKVASVGESRIVLLRVSLPGSSIWYDSSQQLTAEDLAVRLCGPRIAISWRKDVSQSPDAVRIYNETSQHWIFPSAVKSALSELKQWSVA